MRISILIVGPKRVKSWNFGWLLQEVCTVLVVAVFYFLNIKTDAVH